MNTKQFKEACNMLEDSVTNAASKLRWASFLLKFSTEPQRTKLAKRYPDNFAMSKKSGNIVVKQIKSEEPLDLPVNPDSIVVNKTISVLGPYDTEAVATREASEFLHPQVMFYRSSLFPNPKSFDVEVTVTAAEVIKIKDVNPLKQFGIELMMDVKGPSAKTDVWVSRFEAQVRLKLVG